MAKVNRNYNQWFHLVRPASIYRPRFVACPGCALSQLRAETATGEPVPRTAAARPVRQCDASFLLNDANSRC